MTEKHDLVVNAIGRALRYKAKGYSNVRTVEAVLRDLGIGKSSAVAGESKNTQQERSALCVHASE